MYSNIRKTVLTLLLPMAAMASAQLLEVNSIAKVEMSDDVAVGSAIISPSGQSLLVTDPGYVGLTQINLSDGSAKVITRDEGAGYRPIFIDDDNVAYRKISYTKDNLKRTELRRRELSTGKDASIVGATRDLSGAVAVKGSVYAIHGGKAKRLAVARGAKVNKAQPVLTIDNRQLMLTVGDVTKRISPNGTEESYIWPSVSPDGTKALYFVCGEGAYVSNIDGSSPKFIGIMRAPQWLTDGIVVGMQDEDDGYVTTASKIVATDITSSQTQVLTDSSLVAMYPTADKAASKIAFTTVDGEVYIMDITIK